MAGATSIEGSFTRHTVVGGTSAAQRLLAVEMPIAIEFDGVGYAVLMATPADLDDLAVGFTLAERLADSIDDIVDIDIHDHPAGVIVRIALIPRMRQRVLGRVRHRASDGSCGLCGIENLEQAIRPLPQVVNRFAGASSAVFAALRALDSAQPINEATRAVHAAASCDRDGVVRIAREDVGRHNAFDKLIGAMARDRLTWDGGFALLTSRCSFELVEKAVLAGCPLLATISAPTSLAVARAAEAGLALVSLARSDSFLLAE